MTPDTIIDLSQQALYVIAMIAAPMLLSALAIGLLIGMF
ncbi:MAG: flagellar biosynthetic protein FliQ, partial [Gammaproteobacteria bacterium]|nr:flagellar biosynthetic protein FliQ [Gammaproteobacteria bacterium]